MQYVCSRRGGGVQYCVGGCIATSGVHASSVVAVEVIVLRPTP